MLGNYKNMKKTTHQKDAGGGGREGVGVLEIFFAGYVTSYLHLPLKPFNLVILK